MPGEIWEEEPCCEGGEVLSRVEGEGVSLISASGVIGSVKNDLCLCGVETLGKRWEEACRDHS